MTDEPKITEDQPFPGVTNTQAPKQPAGNEPQKPKPDTAGDREGQTREPGYDEA